MCYSASVSFGSAAFLMATGAVTTLGNRSKSQTMVAAIPFLFGVQQLSEGIVWQTMGHESQSALNHVAVLLFLAFANIIWPAWIPWSLYFIEPVNKRKRILKILSYVGLGVSMISAWVFLTADIKAHVSGHSLAYAISNVKRFWPVNIEILAYILPTMVPFFVSSLKTVKKAGYLIFASLLLAQVINQETTASVWCFFSAIISLYIALDVLWVQRFSGSSFPLKS